MISASEICFWTSAGVIAYVYAGYPLLVWLVGILFPKNVEHADIEPRVTILITAFNEAAALAQKLENTLALDYPREKLEVLIASDGSTDRTDDIAKEWACRGVRLVRTEGRVGKTATQNAAVEASTGDFVFFSDATTLYRDDVVKTMLPFFADDTVGCVSGRLVYVDDMRSNIGSGAKSYWNYETFLKTAESRACSLIGASGCLYAVRRPAYEPMYPEACSDFLICTSLYRKGLRSVFASNAVCFEQTNSQTDDELKMRVRVISQTFTDLWRNRDILNPFKTGFFSVEMFSHKVLRYFVPFFLLGIFVNGLLLASVSTWYFGIVLAQACFYLLALAGWVLERGGKRLSILAMPFYFSLANLASVVGLYKFIRGETYARWEPIRTS